MVLINLEYRLCSGRGILPDIWPLKHTNLIFFVDSGLTWYAEDNSQLLAGFDNHTWSDLKTNIGIALSDRQGRVRLNFAKRTDIGSKPVIITLRLNRAF